MVQLASFLQLYLVVPVSSFVPRVGNGKAFVGPNVVAAPSQGSNIAVRPRSNSVSLSAILESGMDPAFTTIVLGAALMASMSLNPDDEDEAISSSAKSLIAEEKKKVKETKGAVAVAVAPPEKKKVAEETKGAVAINAAPPEEKKVVEEIKATAAVSPPEEKKLAEETETAVAVETTPQPPQKEELVEATKELSFESDQKKVTDMLKRVMAEANARRELEAEAVTEPEEEEISLLPKEEVDPWKRYSQIADTQETLAQTVIEETPPEPQPYSPPAALSPTEDEATNSTPLVVKFITKIVMPWKNFSSI